MFQSFLNYQPCLCKPSGKTHSNRLKKRPWIRQGVGPWEEWEAKQEKLEMIRIQNSYMKLSENLIEDIVKEHFFKRKIKLLVICFSVQRWHEKAVGRSECPRNDQETWWFLVAMSVCPGDVLLCSLCVVYMFLCISLGFWWRLTKLILHIHICSYLH